MIYLVFAAVVCGALLSAILTPGSAAIADTAPAWSQPQAMTIQPVTEPVGIPDEQVLFSNLDCDMLTYRIHDSDVMKQACFVPTAIGLFSGGTNLLISGGTDEAIPVIPFVANQILVPWPGGSLLSLDPVSTDGTYVRIYRNPWASLHEQRDQTKTLIAKNLTGPPDLTVEDPAGQPLVINPQTLAFGGNWLVAETLNGSFVRVNMSTLDVLPFAPAFGSQGSPALLMSRVAITRSGRFVAIMNVDSATFKVYDLDTCSPLTGTLRPSDCQAYDYYPFARQKIPDILAMHHLQFVNEGLLSFEAFGNDRKGHGLYEIAPRARIASETEYIGLGDSFTSGEGAFDYLDGTDTGDNMCHLSRHSYPLLLTDDLFSPASGHAVACSGAVIRDIGASEDSYRGQVRDISSLRDLQQNQPLFLESIKANFRPGYIAQHQFVEQWQPRILTVSIGGNDIGFGNLLQTCVMPHVGLDVQANSCFATYEDRIEVLRLIDRTVPRWTMLYRQLQKEAPASRLYVIGYPQLFDAAGNCSINVRLDQGERGFANMLVDYLNQDIRKAAEAAGVTYVDIGKALAGHRLCETASYNVAVNGLTAGKDGGLLGLKIFGKESYHPNALGQSLIEQAILQQTHNLAGIPEIIPAPATNPALLNAPRSGRPLVARLPSVSLAPDIVNRNSSITVQAEGVTFGLEPRSLYTIHLDGPAGPVIGTTSSDEKGDIHTTVLMPAATLTGGHTIDLIGAGTTEEPVDITQPVYVPASISDSDGDGNPDTSDTCPGVSNSGQDTDQDGIDDICDNLITLPPIIAGGGSADPSPSNQAGAQLSTPTVLTSFILGTRAPSLPIQPIMPQFITISPRDSPSTEPSHSSSLADHRPPLGSGPPQPSASIVHTPSFDRKSHWQLWYRRLTVSCITFTSATGFCWTRVLQLTKNEHIPKA